jgi:hypothetical protein
MQGLAMISGRIWDVGSRNNRHIQVSISLVLLANFLNLFKALASAGTSWRLYSRK